MEIVDQKTVYLIGGSQDGQTSDKTWIIDPTNNFEIKVGPSLNIPRYRVINLILPNSRPLLPHFFTNKQASFFVAFNPEF